MNINELPPIDLILISHAHFDHLDVQSLRAITHKQPYKITCITAFNTKTWLKNFQWKEVFELDWDQDIVIDDIRISA
jgi:L-ascorbate metabolism protein UlaG (beta-lactamase superfamily)